MAQNSRTLQSSLFRHITSSMSVSLPYKTLKVCKTHVYNYIRKVPRLRFNIFHHHLLQTVYLKIDKCTRLYFNIKQFLSPEHNPRPTELSWDPFWRTTRIYEYFRIVDAFLNDCICVETIIACNNNNMNPSLHFISWGYACCYCCMQLPFSMHNCNSFLW